MAYPRREHLRLSSFVACDGMQPASVCEHEPNAVCTVRATALIEVAGLFKLGADLAKRPSLSRLWGRWPQPLGQCYGRLQGLRGFLVWCPGLIRNRPTGSATVSASVEV